MAERDLAQSAISLKSRLSSGRVALMDAVPGFRADHVLTTNYTYCLERSFLPGRDFSFGRARTASRFCLLGPAGTAGRAARRATACARATSPRTPTARPWACGACTERCPLPAGSSWATTVTGACWRGRRPVATVAMAAGRRSQLHARTRPGRSCSCSATSTSSASAWRRARPTCGGCSAASSASATLTGVYFFDNGGGDGLRDRLLEAHGVAINSGVERVPGEYSAFWLPLPVWTRPYAYWSLPPLW